MGWPLLRFAYLLYYDVLQIFVYLEWGPEDLGHMQ